MSEHDISDSQFGKIFATMIAAMVGLTLVLIVIAAIIGGKMSEKMAAQKQADKATEISSRIEPIGKMQVGDATQVIPAATAAAAPSGKGVYDATCAVCHAAGVAGAPKLGDATAWATRIANGQDPLYEHAINGFQGQAGYMPARGGNVNLSDDDVKAAVDYIVENSK